MERLSGPACKSRVVEDTPHGASAERTEAVASFARYSIWLVVCENACSGEGNMSYMSDALGVGEGVELSDLAEPHATRLDPGAALPAQPQHRVYFYDPGEWEQFILEWATALPLRYEQVKRLGGSNDHGVDVAGFLTSDGFEGEWDCFQAKHYASALTLSDVLPEVVKLFTHAITGSYVLPRRYVFVAPQGCGTTLNRLLSRPSDFKSEVLKALEDVSVHVRGLSDDERITLRDYAQGIDYSIFRAMQLHELLEDHATTRYHAARFDVALPQRPAVGQPPVALALEEQRYAEQLLDVYRETSPQEDLDTDTISMHPLHGDHFRRQRYSFYSAEALRVYARDSVPPGTFESLLDDMYDGVIEVADATHPSSRDRLSAVLTHSTQVALDGHRLVAMAGPNDRKGLCHHLANGDRLTWVRSSE